MNLKEIDLVKDGMKIIYKKSFKSLLFLFKLIEMDVGYWFEFE